MTPSPKTEDEDVLTLVGRYGFAMAHCHPSEQELAWNRVVSALRRVRAEAYQDGFSSGASDGDSDSD